MCRTSLQVWASSLLYYSLVLATRGIHALVHRLPLKVPLDPRLDVRSDLLVLESRPAVPLRPWVGIQVREGVLSLARAYEPVAALEAGLEDLVQANRFRGVALLGVGYVFGRVAIEVVGLACGREF